MKTRIIPPIIPVLLSFSILPLAVTSCSTTPNHPASPKTSQTDSSTKPVKADKTRSILIGNWVNEGELAGLTVREDGTCFADYDEPHGARGIKIPGSWTHQGNTLRVNYDKRWWGSDKDKTQTYFLKSGSQHTLWMTLNGEMRSAFYRAGN